MIPSSRPCISERRKITTATRNKPLPNSSTNGAATATSMNSLVPGSPKSKASATKLNATAATAPQPRCGQPIPGGLWFMAIEPEADQDQHWEGQRGQQRGDQRTRRTGDERDQDRNRQATQAKDDHGDPGQCGARTAKQVRWWSRQRGGSWRARGRHRRLDHCSSPFRPHACAS